jgi:hypothetical protein
MPGGAWAVGYSGWSPVDLLAGGLLRPPDVWLLLGTLGPEAVWHLRLGCWHRLRPGSWRVKCVDMIYADHVQTKALFVGYTNLHSVSSGIIIKCIIEA